MEAKTIKLKLKKVEAHKFPISLTRIEKRMQTKSNPILAQTILALKKINPEAAKLMAMPRRKRIQVNVEQLENECKDGDKVLIAGKVLGNGFLTKKIKVVAFSITEEAEEKIKKAKGEFVSILEEVKKNPKLNDLRIVR